MTALAAGAVARNVYVPNGLSSVTVVDSTTNQAEAVPDGKAITVEMAPAAVAMTPDGKHAYVANELSKSVSVIDSATNQVEAVPDGRAIAVGERPHAIALTPDGKHAYVANEESNNVSVIDTATNTVEAVPNGKAITVGNVPLGIAITPDGKHAYVANAESNSVSVIDTATNTVATTITVGNVPRAIAITPDGKHAYVANAESNSVSVIDTATSTVEAVPDGKAITVGTEPFAIAIAPDGRRAYVANSNSGTVSVIDTATNTVEAVPGKAITVGERPFGIAIAPDGKHAYVVNAGSNNLSVIDTATNQAAATIPVDSPDAIAITPDQPPTASFKSARARPGVPVALNASASNDPDGSIATFAWAFGDKQSARLTSPKVTHSYRSPGTYRATLSVTDNEGCSASEIFTGQTASCNGSAPATKTLSVRVAYPGVRVRCPRSAGSRGCRFSLRAITRARGGKAESALAKVRLRAGKSAIVSLKAKPAFRRRLAAARRVLVEETARIGGSMRTRVSKLKIVQ
jgi:YVTN family beta-propeller protein